MNDRLDAGSLCTVLVTVLVVLGGVGVYVSVAPAAAATTLVVDDDGGTGYQTIQSALDAATDGDTVEVRPGVYRESVSVDNAVTLVAPSGATLNGSTVSEPSFGAGTVGIIVDPTLGPGLTIEGFTVERYTDGITVGASAEESYNDGGEEDISGGWVIRDVVVRNNAEDGIDVGPAVGSAWTIQNTTAVGNGDDGIEAGGFGGTVAWRIVGSNASLNRDVGITVGASSGDWEILDSATNGNFDGLGMGVYILSRDSAWTIGNHTATGNSFYGIDVAGSFSGAWTIHNSTLADNSGSGLNAQATESDWVVRDTNLSGNYDWGLRAGNAPDNFRIRNVTVVGNSLGGVGLTYTEGNWRIDGSRIESNGDYRGRFGVNAEYTTGSWSVNNTAIDGNVNGGINAEEGSDGRPVGDATDNWWGQPGGPVDNQCVGNVDCGSPLTSEPGTSQPATVGVNGTVTNASGAALSGIDVNVYRESSSGTFLLAETTTTDTTGRYDTPIDLPSGETSARLKVRFNDSNGVYATEWYDGQRGEIDADVLDVAAGENATADADLDDNVATVYGWVRNESGDPLEGMLVVPYREDSGGEFRQLPGIGTDGTGQYTYEVDVPAGESGVTLKLLFADPDDVYASRYYDDATVLADAVEVYVPAGERRLVSETLPEEDDVTAGFAGTVTNESGTPLADIDVTVFRDDGTGTFREWTTESTDAQGRYDIDVRPPESDDRRVYVKLRFTDPTWEYAQEWNSTGYRNVRTQADAAVVNALVGGEQYRDEVLERNVVTVAGRVRNLDGESLEGVLVVPYREEADGDFESYQSATTYTDEVGRYETEVPVRDGETTIDLKVGFFDPDDDYANTYWRNGTTFDRGDVITADAGWELPNVRVEMPRVEDVAVRYQGTVYNENDEALEDVLVTVFRDDGTGTYREWTNFRTDENGYWNGSVVPPAGESNVSVKVRYRDESGHYVEEWEFNETSKATADTYTGTVGDFFNFYGTRLARAPTTQVSGVVREDTWGGGPLEGIRVTVYRYDGSGGFAPFATTTTDQFGYYEFQVPPQPGSSTVTTRLYFTDPAGEYASIWYRDARRYAASERMTTTAGEGNYFNDQWLPEAGMLLDVSVQALSTCPNPADESSCTFPGDEDSVTVSPDEEVAVRYELWNGDDEVYTDYDVDDPATGTTMFGANHQIDPGDTRTTTTTLTSPLVDGSYDYRANATSVSQSGRVSNVSATYTVTVQGSVVQRARVGDRFDVSVADAGTGTPVLVDGGTQGLASLSNTTFDSLLLTTDVGDFTLNVTGSENAPGGTEALSLTSGVDLGYLTVDHSVSDDDVDSVVFRFGVARTRLASAGVSPGDVTLYRYVDGSPTALPTTFTRTSGTEHVFEATSPGLSVFAVGTGERAPAATGDTGGSSSDNDSDGGDSDDGESTTPAPAATGTPASEPTAEPERASATIEPSGDAEDTPTAATSSPTGATPTGTELSTTSTTFDGFGPFTMLLALLAVLSTVLFGRRRQER